MAKQKYYYVIVNKENGTMLNYGITLPIFKNKKLANIYISNNIDYIIHKISVNELEDIILISEKFNYGKR